MDFYQTLNLSPTANETDIKKAYRSLSFQYHPDKNPDPAAAVKMTQINEAYETLGDVQKRKQYDNRNNPMNMDSIIKEMFRPENMFPHQTRQSNVFEEIFKMHNMGGMGININGMHGVHMHNMGGMHMGEPVVFTHFEGIPENMNMNMNIEPLDKTIEVSFEQSFSGANIPLTIEREFRKGNNMVKEQEKIYLNIPSGIDDGEIIEIPDKGNVMGDRRGPLRLHLKIMKHEKFERKGLDLLFKQTITFKESICGLDQMIHFIDGSPLKLKSSRGNIIQNGDEKTVKGKGFNRGGQMGDLIIIFKVMTQELTEEHIALFEKIL